MTFARERLFAFVFLLLTLNALTTFVVSAVNNQGWLIASLNLFDVSAIVWLAVAAALALLWDARGTAIGKLDGLTLVAATLAALLPVSAASSAMLTVIGLWSWRSSHPGSTLRRSSAIILSVTAFLLWGRLVLAWGAGPLLSADASFVAWLAGTRSAGNLISFPDGTNFMIAPACSSFHGVSLALILWTTVTQYFAIALDRRVLLTLALAVAGSILVNGLRLSLIAWNPHSFDYWHVGTGAALFGWLALTVIAGVIYLGLANARKLA